MGSNSRYDRFRPVGDREAAEARAMYLIAELVKDYPGISSSDVAGQVAHALYAASNELRSGRALPIEVRRAVRGLADALRREMDPRRFRLLTAASVALCLGHGLVNHPIDRPRDLLAGP